LWAHGGYSKDSLVKIMDVIECGMPKSEAAWVNVIANCCRKDRGRSLTRAIPQITETVGSSVIRRVENEVGQEVGKIDITVNDVLLPRLPWRRVASTH